MGDPIPYQVKNEPGDLRATSVLQTMFIMSRPFSGTAHHSETGLGTETGWKWDGSPPKRQIGSKKNTFAPVWEALQNFENGQKHGGERAQLGGGELAQNNFRKSGNWCSF